MAQKKLTLVAGGVVVALGGIWWGLQSYATSQAEDRLIAYLNKNELRDFVHWDNITASPLGTTTLEGVALGERGRPEVLVKSITIKDLENSSDHQSADVVFKDVTLPDGFSPLSNLDFILQAGKTDLPPGTLNLKWDYEREDDKADVSITVQQPAAMDVTLNLQLERVNRLIAENTIGTFMEIATAGYMGNSSLYRVLQPVRDVRIKGIEMQVKDDGYIQRSIELSKRYLARIVPGQGSAESQRNKSFEERIDVSKEACIDDKQMAMFVNNKEACQAWYDFISGDDKMLSIKSTTRSSIALSELLQSRELDYERMLGMFSAELKN